MHKFGLVAAVFVALAAAGGWARSTVATADVVSKQAASVDVFALQSHAPDLPVSTIEDFI